MSSSRPARLSPEKGAEIVGVVLGLAALLIGLSFVTYHPDDPSVLHGTPEPRGVRNLIGPWGAHLAALGFGLLGISALLVPVLLAVSAWRRVRRSRGERVVGRGLGAIVVLATLPGLIQLVLGDIEWRAEPIASGGALGRLGAEALSEAVGFAGALFILLGGVVVGSALLIQSTLGELLVAWRRRLASLWEAMTLAAARRREQKEKERSRRRVIEKQLARVQERADPAEEVEDDPPLRAVEKKGAKGFSIRRVESRTPVPEPRGVTSPTRSRPTAPRRSADPTTPASKVEQIPLPAAARPAKLPPLNLLEVSPVKSNVDEDELVRLGEAIRTRCAEFGVEGSVESITPGPVITVFEFQPAPGVKVSQIVNLQDDLALALKAESVRIERLPGRSTLGIEVPNGSRGTIHIGHLLSQEAFRKESSPLTMALGTSIHGEPFYADLATMPHLLVAGATGAGKSVGLQSMITSILYRASREQVQFIFIDPKRIELGVYRNIPHLKTEVVVEPKKAANALRWAVAEMERRYRLLAEVHVRSLDYYNRAIRDPAVQERLALTDDAESESRADLKPLPYYVVIIDELADLMMVSASEVESSIARLAQMARAVGIHLIVATQRPSVDILTGTIKANFPCRIAYATASRHDSRTILDAIGAEKLLGKGDMLFMGPSTSRLVRLHGAYVSEQETAGIVRWMKKQGPPDLDPAVVAPPPESRSAGANGDEDDDLYDDAVRLVVAEQQASASFLQRRMRVGFSRASRLIDMMERNGLLGPPQGSKPREVLAKPEDLAELDSGG